MQPYEPVVKEEIKRRGEKVSHYSAREISERAHAFLIEHRDELMPEAIARARAMILSGVLGKKAQRALCAEININIQNTTEPKSATSA